MSQLNIEKMHSILKQHGYRVTTPRDQLFRLFDNPEPLSMNDLLKKAGGRLDRVSIYRNVEIFEELHIIKRIVIGWKYKLELSDLFLSHHHHLSCTACGSITDTPDTNELEDYMRRIASKNNFEITDHQFEISGICVRCQKGRATNPSITL